MSHLVWLLTATVLMLPGMVGLLIPVIPGIPYMFLVALLFGFFTGFDFLTSQEIVILLIIAIVSIAVDYLAGFMGAKYSGASARALGAGVVGMLVGLLLFPPFGGLIGLFIGVLLVELRTRTTHEALKSATGSLIGSLAGILTNIMLAILFVVLFLVFGWR